MTIFDDIWWNYYTVDGSEILLDVKNLENHDYARTYQLVITVSRISSINSIITCSLSLQSLKHPTIEAQGARAFVKLFFDVGQADETTEMQVFIWKGILLESGILEEDLHPLKNKTQQIRCLKI